MSFLEGKEGTQIFGENITIVDDPLCELAPSQDSFDDEGVSAKTKTVVENGVFKTFLHNLKTAKMMNTTTTGNGYKGGSGIGIRAVNVAIKPGKVSEEEMLAKVKEGIYVTSLSGLHSGMNAQSGNFSLIAQGFLIKEGKLAEPVSLITFAGNLFDVFNNVGMVANNNELQTNSYSVPSIFVKSIQVSGK